MATTPALTPAPTPAPVGMMGPTPAPTPAPVKNYAWYLENAGQDDRVAANAIMADNNLAPTFTPDQLAQPRDIDTTAVLTKAFGSVEASPYAGMMGAAPAPAPAPAASAPAPTQAPANASVIDWYRNVAGRDATAEEVAYWNNQVATGGGEAAYAAFQRGLAANGEVNKGLDYNAANAAYGGATSANGGSLVDDWARNELGRAATPEELAMFGDYARTPAEAEADYRRFLEAATASGATPKNLGLVQASQLGGGQPQTATQAYGGGLQRFNPDLNSQVDARNETIEGRINGLTAQDAQGNYTNPVVRQAVDRAMQSFAARGMLNSSMAVQAAQEAAIAKAIEIAGPDAQTYFQTRRANQDARNVFARDETQQNYTERNNLAQWAQDAWKQNDQQGHDEYMADKDREFRDKILNQEQSFTLRQNYIEANDNANARFNAAINNINASNMTPEDKSVAIAQAQAVRDGDLAYNNNLFAAQPGFAREWLSVAVPTQGMDIPTINNPDTLANIVNDPAQAQATRDAANARMREIQTNPPADVKAQGEATTYDAYKAAGGTMTQAQWSVGQQQGWMETGAGGDGDGGASGGDSGSSGGDSGGGMSA